MSIGLKRPFTADEQECCKISEARFCEHSSLVTKAQECPLCDRATIVHPHSNPQDDLYPRYCIHCAEEFPSDDLRVITFEHNPYEQDEDGGLCCICFACLREEDESSK